MKRIVAFFRPNTLDDVVFALHKLDGFPGATISEVQDIGGAWREHVTQTKRAAPDRFPRYTRMEIACEDALAVRIIETIRHKAHKGAGDAGSIHVSPVEETFRIGSDEGAGTIA